MKRRLKVVVEADGGARGNPGPAGYGAVVAEAGTGEVLVTRFAAIGVATNNVAEYSGLLAGLQAAADLGAVEVEVRMDSRLVVEQMAGRWQIKHPGLRPLAAQAAGLVARFDTVRFVWVPRERNRRADALANAAMDGRPEPEIEGLPGSEPGPGAPASPTDAVHPADGPASGGRTDSGRAEGGRGVGARTAGGPRIWGPRSDPATRLVLVRHGETELTSQGRYSGRGDVPLSERGRAQAAAVADRVAALVDRSAAVVTSPLARCRLTAETIAARLTDPAVRVEPDVIECDFGEWEGLTFAEVARRWPDEQAAWLASADVAPPGGESFEQVAVRARRAGERARAEHPGEAVVLVSHVTPIKLMLRDALDSGDGLLYRLLLDPAGISIVDTWPDGAVSVRSVNDTAHLT